MRKSRKTQPFDVVNYGLFALLCSVSLLPFVHLLAKSLSSRNSVIRGEVALLPINPQLEAYAYVIGNTQFLNSLLVSVFLATFGTFISVTLTAMVAYPLSKSGFRGRKLILYAFVFAWLFAPSIVPVFFLMRSLGLLNNLLSLILIDVIWCFNMLIVKSYFEGIPDSLPESAQIEGASNIRILFSIIMPVAKPVIATITIYSAFGYWNMYFWPVLFISRPSLKPLQLYIYELVFSASNNLSGNVMDDASRFKSVVPDIIRSATVFVSMIPVMAVYPFVQKHFVKGIMLGSVKG